MAKRGYKLQEFPAHSTNVNCLSIGKKACRLFITGGDDYKVNLWAIGKPTSLMSLCGHTSPVESVAFDTAEVLVLAGASTGAIKLWDLEESKLVRTLNGHRSNSTAVEFHPFGEFFASGSTDTNLKIWDIRKKGCIHTYKGHTGGISNIRFTPDGRWIVSGGFDNVVKVWDLTAGKHLHDFKFHDGPIRSMDFHPLEFLLATGSADRTVKFWDLETFELIGSAIPEETGVRKITFHPDGRTLFCGLDDSLKVYSWEPVICHDAIDLGWSTLGDICIHEGKLLGCSYYRNSVGVWVADTSLVKPYRTGFVPEENDCRLQKVDVPTGLTSDRLVGGARSLRSISPSCESKEIKNIYVDCSGGTTTASPRPGSLSPEMTLPLDKKEMSKPPTEKRSPIKAVDWKSGEQALDKSFIAPTVVPRDTPSEKGSPNSGREAITFSKTKPGMLLRPAHARKQSNSRIEIDKLTPPLEVVTINTVSEKEFAKDLNLETQILVEDGSEISSEEKSSSMKIVSEKFDKTLLLEKPSSDMNCDESANAAKQTPSVKIVNGVAVVSGRTRSLVEKFERREKLSSEDEAMSTTCLIAHEVNKTPTLGMNIARPAASDTKRTLVTVPDVTPGVKVPPTTASNTTPYTSVPSPVSYVTPQNDVSPAASNTKRTPVTVPNMTPAVSVPAKASNTTPRTSVPSPVSYVTPRNDVSPAASSNTTLHVDVPSSASALSSSVNGPFTPSTVTSRTNVSSVTSRVSVPSVTYTKTSRINVVPEIDRTPSPPCIMNPQPVSETDRAPPETSVTPSIVCGMNRTPIMPKEEPQVSGRDFSSAGYRDITEGLLETHDAFLSTLKSRLTKLQVVRHFWARNDMKGAINALRKLPDHSVQADVISILMERMEILTLDLFAYLLPVLVGLLDSKTERHGILSLEMLLKLVAVFGPVIHSTISAPPVVGVDLHAEQRRECCNQCHLQLQKIQQILPALLRKGGLLAKSALELNLVLQQS